MSAADSGHVPVLRNEVVDALQPRDGGRYVDGTFGAGGYTTAILNRAECEVIVDSCANAVQAHQVAVNAEHNLLHALPQLAAALVHADPQAKAGHDHHAVLASHR